MLDNNPTQTTSPWQIKLLYDGECPLCLREVNFLKKRDQEQGKIAFVDIADPNYQPSEHENIDYETAMGRIHAILADGTVITDLEVFRQVYDILGIGWIYAITKTPVIKTIADKIYEIWAKLRLKLTGRPNLDTLVAQRQQKIDSSSQGRCRLNKRQTC